MSELSWSVSDTRVAATYSSKEKVQEAKRQIQDKLSISAKSITVVEPSKKIDGKALEGDSRKIGKSLLSAHLVYGFIGVIVGLVIAWFLVNFGPEFAQLNPEFTFIALISPGLFIGLFLSGFLSLQPQRDPVNMNVKQAVESGHWALFVELDDTNKERSQVLPVLKATHAEKIV